MDTIFTDIEVAHEFFYVGFKRKRDGKRVGVEFSRRKPRYDRVFVRRIILRNETVGFNSLAFDLPLILYSLEEHVTNADLKRASDHIIKSNIKPWEVEDYLGIRVPWGLKTQHIDLMEVQPNAQASLKILNGRMHGNRLQDLPFNPEDRLSDIDMDAVADYCLHADLDATENLYNTLEEPLELRRALGEKHGEYFMSKSDSQIGEAIVKKHVEKLSGKKIVKNPPKPGTKFKYPVPESIKFTTPRLQALLQRVRETEFEIGPKNKVISPDWMNGDEAKIELGGMVYSFGIGGIHSTEKSRAIISDDEHVYIDADVASQYPTAILMLGLYPAALGREFLTAYRQIRDERLIAKKRSKEIKAELKTAGDNYATQLRQELLECVVKDKGGKIQLNGVYGKLGSYYSALYGPQLLLSTTLTCQLTILMLIERTLSTDIRVVSGNTDGVVFRCPRKTYNGTVGDRLVESELEAITSRWESDTGFDLEFNEYAASYNRSVNDYFAIGADGSHKRKGANGNPWNPHPSDFDPVRGQLMKNPQMTICSDAVLAKIKDSIPVEDTIRSCTDIRQFVTVQAVTGGGMWQGKKLGKAVRFYWAKGGEPIYRIKANAQGTHGKVPNTEGARPMMDLVDTLPDDIDYEKYIAEAEDLLKHFGYYGPLPEKRKRLRITKKNHIAVLSAFATAI